MVRLDNTTGSHNPLGQFVNGVRQGDGLFRYPNGDIYSGKWKYGKKHGPGTYIFQKTKMKMKGDWDEGSLQKGQWEMVNGDYYEGEFAHNKPKGAG